MVEKCNSLVIRFQVSRQMQVGDACPLPLWDMPIHCHAWVYIIFYEILIENCQWKETPFYSVTDLYFNQEPIRLQQVSVKNLNLFFLTFLQQCFSKSADVLLSFLLFWCKMKCTIKEKLQTNGMIVIHQGYSTVKIHTLKMCGFMQDMVLTKHWARQLKPEKIRISELSYQLEKLYIETLLEVLSKSIAEKIHTTFKK